MSLRLYITPRADLDLVEIAEYIAMDRPVTAARFLQLAVASMNFLTRTPKAGSQYKVANPRLAGLRKWSVNGFRKFLIFYLLEEDVANVILRCA